MYTEEREEGMDGSVDCLQRGMFTGERAHVEEAENVHRQGENLCRGEDMDGRCGECSQKGEESSQRR